VNWKTELYQLMITHELNKAQKRLLILLQNDLKNKTSPPPDRLSESDEEATSRPTKESEAGHNRPAQHGDRSAGAAQHICEAGDCDPDHEDLVDDTFNHVSLLLGELDQPTNHFVG